MRNAAVAGDDEVPADAERPDGPRSARHTIGDNDAAVAAIGDERVVLIVVAHIQRSDRVVRWPRLVVLDQVYLLVEGRRRVDQLLANEGGLLRVDPQIPWTLHTVEEHVRRRRDAVENSHGHVPARAD